MGAVPDLPVGSAGTTFEVQLRARILGSLFGVGATLSLLTVLLPHSPRADTQGMLVVVLIAYAVAGALLWKARSLPSWTLLVLIACGTTLITAVAYLSGEAPSPLTFFYLWVLLFSSYFFTRPQAVVQIAYVGASYATLLMLRPPPSGTVGWWVVTMGTLAVAAVLVQAMRNRVDSLISHLYGAARTDPLTRLPNRRGFRELLDLELERARRSGTRMTVVVGDIDHFKEVNDRSGHHVGDAVLRRVAELLADGKRQIDAAARVGGEEFALVLPDTAEHGAFILAERLRERVREAFAVDAVPITISFGVASFPAHAETASSLLRAADEALYAAKESGRNRTVLHSVALRDVHGAVRDTRDIEGERFLSVVLDLAEAADLRFSGSARHSETVGRYAELMARGLGLSEQHVGRVRLAGLLHDVGKVGVPHEVLAKPGALSDEEFAVVRRHPELGAQILDHPSLADVRRWVECHHERPDGTGYPHGLAGDDVPLEARIVAVADAYEAMTSDRSYRDAVGHVAARVELERCAGSQFDERVVRAFLAVLDHESERARTLVVGA